MRFVPPEDRCCAQVHNGPHTASFHRCLRRATVRRPEGLAGYCTQHDPEAVKRRQAEREARWKANHEGAIARMEYEKSISRVAYAALASRGRQSKALTRAVVAHLKRWPVTL